MTAAYSVDAAGALSLYPAHQAMALTSVAMQLAALLERTVPPLWLYGALTAGAALYATLFGLGAAAYRTLYLTPLRQVTK